MTAILTPPPLLDREIISVFRPRLFVTTLITWKFPHHPIRIQETPISSNQNTEVFVSEFVNGLYI